MRVCQPGQVKSPAQMEDGARQPAHNQIVSNQMHALVEYATPEEAALACKQLTEDSSWLPPPPPPSFRALLSSFPLLHSNMTAQALTGMDCHVMAATHPWPAHPRVWCHLGKHHPLAWTKPPWCLSCRRAGLKVRPLVRGNGGKNKWGNYHDHQDTEHPHKEPEASKAQHASTLKDVPVKKVRPPRRLWVPRTQMGS